MFLLEYFFHSFQSVMSVSKYTAYDDDTINTHISHIRKKIKAITNEDYIQTIWGIGYKIK